MADDYNSPLNEGDSKRSLYRLVALSATAFGLGTAELANYMNSNLLRAAGLSIAAPGITYMAVSETKRVRRPNATEQRSVVLRVTTELENKILEL